MATRLVRVRVVKLGDEFIAVYKVLCKFPSGADISVSCPLDEIFNPAGASPAPYARVDDSLNFPFC